MENTEFENMELEMEGDTRPDDMEDEIIIIDEHGKPVAVEVEDDTEDVEEPNYAEYD